MTYEALKINAFVRARKEADKYKSVIEAVLKLHTKAVLLENSPFKDYCRIDRETYPCRTVQAIEKELA